MLTFDGIWHFGEVFSSRMNPSFHCTEQMADSVYGVVWVSSLLMSTLWIECPMVLVRVWYGQAFFYGQQTQVHFIDGILNAQRYRDEIMRPIVVPFNHDHHLILQHDNALPHVPRICTQSLEAENIPVLAWPAYHGMDQHSTGHNQQPDQLYAKTQFLTQLTMYSHGWSFQTGLKTPKITTTLKVVIYDF